MKPSEIRFAASSPERVCRPAAIPFSSHARRIRTSAASNASATDGSVEVVPPTASVRSDGPMYSPSRPGVAAMASTLSSPSGVSIMASTTTDASASAGAGPIRSMERIGP